MSNPSASDLDAQGVDPDTAAVAAQVAALGDTADASDDPDRPDAGADLADAPSLSRFTDLDLSRELHAALEDMGYFHPTPVQAATFAPAMAGKDLMVQARTGTGKTTAFGLPIISSIDFARRTPQAIILTPTRELALQVSRELGMLGKPSGLVVETIYGGAPIGKQITALKNGVHVVVGTPGRVLDHIGRRTLDLKQIRFFVLDECDEMLSMGFLEDIDKIASYTPKDKQTMLFSATMPDEVRRYAKRQMKAPEHIALSTGNISVEEIHHAYYIVSGVARSRDLLRILIAEKPESAIIFCNTRDETGMVARFLQKQGLDAEALSSDLTQSDRERVMKRMRDKNLKFLVATDVAARGIDIIDLSHVINYSFPESAEVYVHRTGRTGRAGKKGTALSLIGPRELGAFWYLKILYKIQPEERDLPPASVLDGVLKTPLPRLGPPPPVDPLNTLRGVVSGEPKEEFLALAKKLVAEADGEKLVALMLGEKLDAVAAQKAAQKAAADAARREREEAERRERDERGDGGPRWGRDRDDRGGR
ncbi:MAG TPA: DEAD/DEAH box helicase, partial [Kofleriaceae bacterium]|nr:DEAD/DEAH box helicase [Kofleriaceae bacterium]